MTLSKVIESYNEKKVYIFFVTKAIHTNEDNCNQKQAEKKFKFIFYMMV